MSKPSCFIIMPLTTPGQCIEAYKGDSDHFRHVLKHLFIPAIEAAGMDPKPPISKGSEVIHGGIIRNLETADLVLCDMSILNPNVFFELGIRTALNKSVALIRDNVTERVPFDTTIINYHEYDSGLEPWTLDKEIEKLTVHLKDCTENGNGNSLWGYFSMSQQAEVPNDAPEVEKQLAYLIKQVESMRSERATPKRVTVSLNPDLFSDEDKANELYNTIEKIVNENSQGKVTQLEVLLDGTVIVYTNERLSINTRHFLGDFVLDKGFTEVKFFTGNGYYGRRRPSEA